MIRSIQGQPTNAADRAYFARLNEQTQDALWAEADYALIAYRLTVAAAWKGAIQKHKDEVSPADQTTPELVREFVDIKCADARGELTTRVRHDRLSAVVDELRSRNVLD